jgi:hypothetical protein
MATDIKAAWETYTARSVFLISDILRIGLELDDEDCAELYGADTKADGRSLSWRSETLKSVLASLLLIDLASLLEEALDVVLDGKPAPSDRNWRRGLAGKLKWARELGILLDFADLDALKDERNKVAHERYTMTWTRLRGRESIVRRQLDAWSLIPNVDTFNATLSVGDWQGSSKHWKREIWAGVESWERTRAWGLTITETANKGPDVARPEHARAFGHDETSAEWYTLEPPDADGK